GGSYSYTFTAPPAGTYLFYDSLSPVHRSMGLYGAMVVAPADGSRRLWAGGPAYDAQYLWLVSSLDEVWNRAAAAGKPVDTKQYRPNYFLLNGKGGGEGDHAGLTTLMVHGQVGQTMLIRRANASLVPHALHYHGFHFREVTRNGQALQHPRLKDTSLLRPLDTADILITFDQPGHYPVHDHILMAATANGSYPNGIMAMLAAE
ncbi:MAG TPA: multicopper oxidase domain-containing protein, partial [Symbiobacteriaceae bacterium]|nr:multicopper oxidase domain-containing protein [Symbiobacteriaceae bacterium]